MSRFTSPIERDLESGRLAWIMGSSRSGSTWLLRMLSELPEAVPIDDPHLGHHLGVWRPIPLAWAASEREPEPTTLLDLKDEKPGYFFSERYADAWKPALRKLILARFAAQAAESGHSSPLAIVKEPGSQAAGLLLSLFPASRLVFLLRDGRDVVDSWLAAYADGAWAQDEGAFPLAEEGRDAFIRWQSAVWAHRTAEVLAAYETHAPDRRVLVRYENLRADPAAELRRICAAIGCGSSEEDLDAIAAKHEIEAVPRSRRGQDKEIRIASPGSWRESMSAGEQDAMHSVLGPVLQRAGYVDVAPPVRSAGFTDPAVGTRTA